MNNMAKANIAPLALAIGSALLAILAPIISFISPNYPAYLISFSVALLLVSAVLYKIPEGESHIKSARNAKAFAFGKRIMRAASPIALALIMIFLLIIESFAVLVKLDAVQITGDMGRFVAGAYLAILSMFLLVGALVASLLVFFPVKKKRVEGASKTIAIVLDSVAGAFTAFALVINSGILAPIFEQHHYMYAIAAAIMAEFAAMHIYFGLNSIYGLLRGFDVAKKLEMEPSEKTRRRMWIIYVSSLVFIVLFISAAFASKFNAIFAESTFVRDLLIIIYLVIGVVLIIYLLVHYLYQRKKEAPSMQRRQTPEEAARKILILMSFGVAGILGVLGILMYLGTMKPIPIVGSASITSIDMIVAALLIGLGPYGFYRNADMKRTSQMEAKFPDFLRDLSESKRAGMTLTNALLTTAKGRYGALTPEIRKMASQITWGVSFVEALKLFAERVHTPLIERSVSLIIEASNSGGNVVEILKAAADDAREIKQIQAERKQSMGIYVIIIYLAFLVFIAVIEIMYSQFIPQIYSAVSGAAGASVGGMTFRPFDIEVYKTLFFHAALIQGIGGGLVAGVMEEGKAITGLRHAFIMIIISYMAFRFVVV